VLDLADKTKQIKNTERENAATYDVAFMVKALAVQLYEVCV
jgi:hypothetical protein